MSISVCVAVDTGLFKSLVLSTLPSPTEVLSIVQVLSIDKSLVSLLIVSVRVVGTVVVNSLSTSVKLEFTLSKPSRKV